MLPTKIYYVEVQPGGTPLPYRQRGGKIYTVEQHAINHRDTLLRLGANARVMILESPFWRELK
jgi:hypothetical protein